MTQRKKIGNKMKLINALGLIHACLFSVCFSNSLVKNIQELDKNKQSCEKLFFLNFDPLALKTPALCFKYVSINVVANNFKN